jgi:hypothetical protein
MQKWVTSFLLTKTQGVISVSQERANSEVDERGARTTIVEKWVHQLAVNANRGRNFQSSYALTVCVETSIEKK